MHNGRLRLESPGSEAALAPRCRDLGLLWNFAESLAAAAVKRTTHEAAAAAAAAVLGIVTDHLLLPAHPLAAQPPAQVLLLLIHQPNLFLFPRHGATLITALGSTTAATTAATAAESVTAARGSARGTGRVGARAEQPAVLASEGPSAAVGAAATIWAPGPTTADATTFRNTHATAAAAATLGTVAHGLSQRSAVLPGTQPASGQINSTARTACSASFNAAAAAAVSTRDQRGGAQGLRGAPKPGKAHLGARPAGALLRSSHRLLRSRQCPQRVHVAPELLKRRTPEHGLLPLTFLATQATAVIPFAAAAAAVATSRCAGA